MIKSLPIYYFVSVQSVIVCMQSTWSTTLLSIWSGHYFPVFFNFLQQVVLIPHGISLFFNFISFEVHNHSFYSINHVLQSSSVYQMETTLLVFYHTQMIIEIFFNTIIQHSKHRILTQKKV